MNPDNVPPWGCPWHGLIENGVLTAPNGQELTWPEFATLPYQAGATHLQQAPGVPEPVRSEDEQTVDAERGYQWRNWAMLTGGAPHLHGQWLGGWIYCAADGSKWLVDRQSFGSVPMGGSAWHGTAIAMRFGLFGVDPDEREVPFSLDPEQPAVSWVAGALNLELHAVTPDGSAAILMATSSSHPIHEQVVPFGFYLVELSGGFDDLEISVSVLYGQTATMGSSSGSFPEQTTNEFGDVISSGPWSASILGRVHGAWFDAGEVVPVLVDMEWSGELDNPAPTGSPQGRTCTSTSSLTWTLKAGAAVIDTLTASATQTIIAHRDDPEIEGDQSVLDETNIITVLGDERTYMSSGSIGVGESLPSAGPQLLNMWAATPVNNTHPGVAPIMTDEPERFVLGYVHRYSNSLFGWAIRWHEILAATMTVTYRSAAHPAGIDVGELQVPGDIADPSIGYLPYGSYHPVTGEVTRNAAASVCYV